MLLPVSVAEKDMLTDAEKNDVLDGIKMYNVLNKPVDASLVASMARGILGRDRSELLSENGGPYVISCSWARRFLHDNGFTVRAATSDRTVSPPEVKKAGLSFYDELKKYSHILPELVFNMDEFFSKLDETNREWTWVRASKGKSIQLAGTRLGFTSTILVSADCVLHRAHFLWKGVTDGVHAKVPHKEHNKRIIQDHRAASHFQDAESFKKWTQDFKEVLAEIRTKLGDSTLPALLLIDQASQHKEILTLLSDTGCSVEFIPPKMTHIFQPCNQYAISNIKKHSRTAWRGWVQSIQSRYWFPPQAPEHTVRAFDLIPLALNRSRKTRAFTTVCLPSPPPPGSKLFIKNTKK